MATRKRIKGNSKGAVLNVLWFIFVGSLIVLFFNIPAKPTVDNLPGIIISKSNTLSAWMQNCVPNAVKGEFSQCSFEINRDGGAINPNPPAPAPNTPAPAVALQQLNSLPVAVAEDVAYNRDDWNHWVSQTSSCWDTRDQVLYDEAVKDGSLKLADKSKNETIDLAAACAVTAGTWNDPYTGTVVTNPKELDIDHMIPLSYAAQHGGQGWDSARKQQYANDLSNIQHLLAVVAGENRSKSDRGPSEWVPKNTAYFCQYATDWVSISTNYGLTVTELDKSKLSEMLATCPA